MPVSGEREIIGPKTVTLPCPNVEAFFNTFVGQRLLTVNTAPRAGQDWEILSATFRFPEAKRNNVYVLPGVRVTFTFVISMLVGGVVVAEQEFIETQNTDEPKEEPEIPMHILGSLEPFAPPIVYPGQSLDFQYLISKNVAGALFAQSGPGLITVQYNLVRHKRGRSR